VGLPGSTLSIDRTAQEATGERGKAQGEVRRQRLGLHHRDVVPLGLILAFKVRFDRMEGPRVPDRATWWNASSSTSQGGTAPSPEEATAISVAAQRKNPIGQQSRKETER
jgi:hypothetical protein